MVSSKFEIPAEFGHQLCYVEPQDKRTDAEILESLSHYSPVTSEKNIWAFWDKGLKSMPTWQQRNVCNWIRLHGKDWTVRVLDHDPGSVNRASNFVSSDLLPSVLKEGRMTGGVLQHAAQHKADLFRSATIYTHGGVWLDVGFIVMRPLDDICWNRIMNPHDPGEVFCIPAHDLSILNGAIAARKGNPWIQRWHQLFAHLWDGRTDTDGIHQHPLLEPCHAARALQPKEEWGVEEAPADWNDTGVSARLDYIAQITCWQRVGMLVDDSTGWNGPEYWSKHMVCFDLMADFWNLETSPGVGHVGQDIFDMLQTRIDAPKDTEQYQTAYTAVWNTLANASLQGIYHAKGLLKSPSYGALLDLHPGADVTPGTFAELLRYGSVHFQKRSPQRYKHDVAPPFCIIERGLFEPGSFTRLSRSKEKAKIEPARAEPVSVTAADEA